MNWLFESINTPSSVQTVIIISLVSAIGLQFGKIKFFNISLGITFVFFIGILLGHFRLNLDKNMLLFAQDFGLIIFVYALGLQVGPSFFSSFRKGGLALNMLSLALAVIGLIMTVAMSYVTGISLPQIIGVFCGATTNTPVLGAAQQTINQILPGDSSSITQMSLACAVAYPLGVIGVILAIIFLKKIFVSKALLDKTNQMGDNDTYVGEFHITNPAVDGLTIKDLMRDAGAKFVISRIWSLGKVSIPTSETVLKLDDHLLTISKKSDVNSIKLLVGEQENVDWNKEDIDWNHIDNSLLVSRRIIVTRSKINGVKLEALRLRNNYGINITRVNRAGIDLLPSPQLMLQIGDRLTVVGEKASIDNVSNILGNELKKLHHPNLISLFTGIALGLILGLLPFPFPGISFPVRLGLAGGPIIVGILMGAFGPRFHMATYVTQSANMLLRQFGITLYLACLGIKAGEHFFETVFQAEGAMWILYGFILTVIPVLIVAIFSMKIMKINYSKSVGMLCGSMANPMALNYINSITDNDEPAVAYATVYPVAMFTRIILTQLIIMMFL